MNSLSTLGYVYERALKEIIWNMLDARMVAIIDSSTKNYENDENDHF